MFETTKTNIKLTVPFNKVLCASHALNNTFVFLLSDSKSKLQTLIHSDAAGKILISIDYKQAANTFGMMNENEVILFNIQQQRVEMINLESRKMHHFYRHFSNNTITLNSITVSSIFTFPQSGLYAFAEIYSLQEDITVSYYNYSTFSQYLKPQAAWKIYGKPNQIYKLNNRSKIGYYRTEQQQHTITYFQFPSKQQKRLTFKSYHESLFETRHLISFWQIRPNVYLCMGSQASRKDTQNPYKKQEQSELICDHYVVDASQNINEPILKSADILIESKLEDKLKKEKVHSAFSFGLYSIFQTFVYSKQRKAFVRIIYIVSNQNNEIQYRQEWQWGFSTCQVLFKQLWNRPALTITHYAPRKDTITITIIRQLSQASIKNIYLHFMLHLNSQFEDGLLKDTIKLLYE